MSTQDVLNIFLILGLLTITICSVIVTYFLIKTLKAVQSMIDNVSETTENFKSKIGLRLLSAIPSLLIALAGKFLKRGR